MGACLVSESHRPATPISTKTGGIPLLPVKAHRGNSRDKSEKKTCRVCGQEGHLQKQCRNAGSGKQGTVEEAAKLAHDQAVGAQIAAQDFSQELKELKLETETIRRERDNLKDKSDRETRQADELTEGLIHSIDFKTGAGHFTVLDRIVFFILFAMFSWAKHTMGWTTPGWIMDWFNTCHDAVFDAWHDGVVGKDLMWWELGATRFKWDRDIPMDSYPDQRPDMNAMQAVKHFNPHYAVIAVAKRWSIVPDAHVVVCMELVAQLTAPQFMNPVDARKTIYERMMKTASGYQWVNFNRYLAFEGHNVAIDSARIAYALYERSRERTIEAFCPPPRSC
jgi:hypothetical protein